MREPDSLADLASELRALPGRQRQAVLASLSAAERSRMMELLNRPHVVPRQSAAPVETKLDRLSPGIAARALEAQSGSAAAGSSSTMTPATRQLLRRCVEELPGREPSAVASAQPARGHSLLEAIGGLLSAKRAAR